MFLGGLYCKQGSILIRFHSVCIHDKIKSEVHLNILCSRHKKQMSSRQKTLVGYPIMVKHFLPLAAIKGTCLSGSPKSHSY